jgi:hypothetical protein
MVDIDRPAESSDNEKRSRPVTDIMELYAQGNILNPGRVYKMHYQLEWLEFMKTHPPGRL